MHYFLIFIGGGAGSVLRYGISQLLLRWAAVFPFATLCANVAASALLMAVMVGVLQGRVSEEERLLVAVGFCGGLSTFSTFSYETLLYLQAHRYGMAALYILCNTLLCMATMWFLVKR